MSLTWSNNWNTAKFNPTTTAFTLNGATTAVTINHGQPVTVGAAVTHSGTTPLTGNVILYTSKDINPNTLDLFHLDSGQASGSTSTLPGANYPYNVWAHYSSDGTYAPSDSNKISVTVSPEHSTTTLSLLATDLHGNPLTSPFPFGSIVFVRADVAGNSGHGIPTGSVSFSDTFGPLPSVNPQVTPPVQVDSIPSLNSQGNTSIGDGIISFDAGNHTISASYVGNSSFKASSSTTPVTFSIQPGFAVVSGMAPVSISAPGAVGTTTVGIVASTGFSNAITFTCNNLPSEATCSSASAAGQGPNAVVNTTITVTSMAPHTTMLHSNERRYYHAALLAGGLPLAGIFFVAAPRRRRWNILLGLTMFALLVSAPACGGGGSSPAPRQDPGTPAGTYVVTLTATAGT
jgi:trimeric autotransporter adhesin